MIHGLFSLDFAFYVHYFHRCINAITSNGFHHQIENTINKLASNMNFAFHGNSFLCQPSACVHLCVCVFNFENKFFLRKHCWPIEWHERKRFIEFPAFVHAKNNSLNLLNFIDFNRANGLSTICAHTIFTFCSTFCSAWQSRDKAFEFGSTGMAIVVLQFVDVS